MTAFYLSKTSFNTRHRRLNCQIMNYSVTKRGRNVVTAQITQSLQVRSAISLKAINYAARIRFAQHLVEQLRKIVRTSLTSKILFVTLILEEHALPFRQAADFDVEDCKAAAKSFLEGFDYVGFVEPAFYQRAPFIAMHTQPFVSWHSHAIVWTDKPHALAKRRTRFNLTNRAFIPGWRAAHFRTIQPRQLASYTRYMAKNVLKEYIVYPKMQEIVDLATGELIKSPTGKWINRKRDIRPKNLVCALTVVGSRTLKHLSFAGRAGKAVRRRALAKTRNMLVRNAAARASETRRLLFGE